MKPNTIEELEAELARQDAALDEAAAHFREVAGDGARFQVPTSFFEELEEACEVRRAGFMSPLSGLKG